LSAPKLLLDHNFSAAGIHVDAANAPNKDAMMAD
jgi:hypothetical protein